MSDKEDILRVSLKQEIKMKTCMYRIVADNDLLKEIERHGIPTFDSNHPCRRCDGVTPCENYAAQMVEVIPGNFGMVEKFEQRYNL